MAWVPSLDMSFCSALTGALKALILVAQSLWQLRLSVWPLVAFSQVAAESDWIWSCLLASRSVGVGVNHH